MMQHYRTHMSPKSRRSQKRGIVEEARPRPRLHAHHRIRSDPVRVEPPLTIDQHLSNYHQSLRTNTNTTNEKYTSVRFNFPLPLTPAVKSPSPLKKSVPIHQKENEKSPSPSTTSLPSIHHIMDDTKVNNNNTYTQHHSKPDTTLLPTTTTTNTTTTTTTTTTTITEKPSINSSLFYQHRPLTFARPHNPSFPYTLLHPAKHEEELADVTQTHHNKKNENHKRPTKSDDKDEDNSNSSSSKKTNNSSSSGLLQLAHIVSTFG
ncbi:uncharacterized protein BX663DRAFT_543857 [Cokeromyces recurvatus]|uniref:uncharacterized protein n=1 Tax=Cokeromyces recurvatus TaxID=90255 RepID=UPI00221E9C9A|nr:uncharacterized protein BX663DRAFT_543857 [Cokeromyces recurvatus]KAI7901946.1 hypothetical protein BX663DRAFT_543857 [Cokeromyces recurvatus]